MTRAFAFATGVLLVSASLTFAQSPALTASAIIGGKHLSIKYSAPSVRGRQIFGDDGLLSRDVNYPVWRAGANASTSFHTDVDLMLGTLAVPKGDYSLYVLVKDPNAWELIVNKATGQWGLTYDAATDLGRVKMTMKKPAAPIETLKYTLSNLGGNKGLLQLEWENHVASVPITVK
ncbi:MAG: DUF2911 domain-containing protein [Terriglobia bacterium]